jgi:hypothetical protein
MGDLEEVFDRWESRVGEIEIAAECADPVDAFEADLEASDEAATLRMELDALRAEEL